MSHLIHTFVCVIKLFLGSEDLVKTNSHPGDPYSLIVEVSSKLGYNWQFCFRYFLIYYLIHLILSFICKQYINDLFFNNVNRLNKNSSIRTEKCPFLVFVPLLDIATCNSK